MRGRRAALLLVAGLRTIGQVQPAAWRRGRSVSSSPERVLFPDEGITKQDLFEYYRAIAPVLVPHLRNRPFDEALALRSGRGGVLP